VTQPVTRSGPRAAVVGVTAPGSGQAPAAFDRAYAELRRTVSRQGLLERTYGYYLWRCLQCFAMLAVALVLPLVLPPGLRWTAPAALLLGFASIQVALIGHDAGHLAVFRSTRTNWVLGLLCWSLCTGIGFWYWYDRHNAHHGHTNDAAADPELQGSGLVAFTVEDAAARRGWRRTVTRYQALLSPFVLLFILFIVFAFRVESWLFAVRRLRGGRRRLELALLALNVLLWVWAIGTLGWRYGEVFLGAQFVAGFYLALIVAPNHKGMPVWASGARLSFLERQVLSSRNITAHPVWDVLYGGLNYQIEHHLFPTMPRVRFRQARALVKPFCASQGLEYEEVGPLASYRAVLLELHRVGRVADDLTWGPLRSGEP
jgi:fatty acid desaturase